MKVNDKLLQKFMAVSANTNYPQHVQDPSQMNNSQAILNISTA